MDQWFESSHILLDRTGIIWNGAAYKVVTAANSKAHAMAGVRGGVGVQDAVGGGVITGGVHGV